MRPYLLSALKWILTLSLLGGLFFGLLLIHKIMRAELDGEEAAEKAAIPPPPRNGVIDLEDDEAERYGLETQTARSVSWHEQTIVYGRVVPNPRATIELRSPFAGTLRANDDSAWPSPGHRLRAGQPLGWVDARVGPEVRLDLQNKLVDARGKQRGAEEEIKLIQDRVNNLKTATAQEIIARTELDAALVQLTQAKTQLASAKAAVELWHKAIEEVERPKSADKSLWSQPLTVPAEGEVTEVAGRPGTAVEAGALVVQLVDFRRPLIRFDIPPELLALGEPLARVEMRIPSFGVSVPALEARLVGLAPRIEAASQFVSYLYEAELAAAKTQENAVSAAVWRPGMQVTTRMHPAGAAVSAVAVPDGAVLYHEGRTLVYVRVAAEKYERREVRLLGREGGQSIVAVRRGKLPIGVATGESVVARQAQLLLSKEFLVGKPDND
jgi:biotin carboxyl carrier protein